MTASVDFVMPSLGADMDSGTITEWLVQVGDSVDRGQIMAIVETDKADIDIEVWESGIVTELLVPPGDPVAVGTPLARLAISAAAPVGKEQTPIESRDGHRSEPTPVSPAPTQGRPADRPAVDQKAVEMVSADHPAVDRIPASPLAKRLAKERGIELADLTGSGPGGAITVADLGRAGSALTEERLTPQPPPPASTMTPTTPAPPSEEKPTDTPTRSSSARMRRAIAELLARSKREIPHYYLASDIDLEVMISWLTEVNAARTVEDRILPAAVLMKAIAAATARHQEFNGFWVDEGFQQGDGVHLGVAVSLRGGGLVAPAIHDADTLSVDDLMSALRDLVARARAGRLRGSEMADPTITVSNLGDRGVEVVHGVIYPPQVALIGLGRIGKRPAVFDDEVVIRHQVSATLAADHRATDGQVGARFLNTINRLLQKPEDL